MIMIWLWADKLGGGSTNLINNHSSFFFFLSQLFESVLLFSNLTLIHLSTSIFFFSSSLVLSYVVCTLTAKSSQSNHVARIVQLIPERNNIPGYSKTVLKLALLRMAWVYLLKGA